MIVLVTGATGFLGGRVAARLLAEGHRVHALHRPGRAAAVPPGAVAVEGDLRNAGDIARAVEPAAAVVHCGARVESGGPTWEFEETNVEATRRILGAATGGRHVIHVSSLSVYDVRRDGDVITEDSPYESGAGDRGLYSQTKLAADRLAMEAAATGAPVTVVRPGVLYGPGRKPPLARQVFALRSFRFILGSPRYLLPLAYGDNVADAIVLALTTPAARGRAYTLVDPQIPLHHYLQIYRAAAGARWRPVFVPAAPLLPVAAAAQAVFRLARRRSPVTPHQIRRATWSAVYDCSRARDELGWRSVIKIAPGLQLSLAATPAPAAEEQGDS
jgi:nucleoside-diphosphate-sugar epimerase